MYELTPYASPIPGYCVALKTLSPAAHPVHSPPAQLIAAPIIAGPAPAWGLQTTSSQTLRIIIRGARIPHWTTRSIMSVASHIGNNWYIVRTGPAAGLESSNPAP